MVTVTPLSQSVEVTHTAKFTAIVTGVGPFNYQWQKGKQNLAGETGPTLNIYNVMHKHQSNYRCIVSNNFGNTVVSKRVHLRVTSMY